MMTKKDLRKFIREEKKKYAAAADRQSKEILAALEAHPRFQAAHTVLLYHSLPDEVNTHAFLDRWRGQKHLLLPVVKGDDLIIRTYSQPSDLQTGAYGIEEPVGSDFEDYQQIDLIIVPGMAFDLQNNRLGRGKGYYDRLLPRIPKAYKIGLCFPYQLLDKIPVEPFDRPMDEVLTI